MTIPAIVIAIAGLIAIASLFWLVPMASNSFDEMED
jgi:hypothetical protein